MPQLNCRARLILLGHPKSQSYNFTRSDLHVTKVRSKLPEATELLPGAFLGAKSFAGLTVLKRPEPPRHGNDSFGNLAIIKVHMASSVMIKTPASPGTLPLHSVYLPTDDSPPSPPAPGTLFHSLSTPHLLPTFILVAKPHSLADPLSLTQQHQSPPITPSFPGLSLLGGCDPTPSCSFYPSETGGVYSLGKDS